MSVGRGDVYPGGRCRRTVLRLALLVLAAAPASAQAQKISVSGSPATLTITTAVTGEAPTSVSSSNTTYSLTGNPTRINKVIGQLNAAMPAGLTLSVTLTPPTGATSPGPVALSTVARDLLTNIPPSAKGDVLAITYTLQAAAAAGIVPLSSRTVTLTIIDLP